LKKIKLLKMEIENFKGCLGKKVFEFSDRTKIFGENASGKTTIADAFNWALFNYDSKGNSKFHIRPQDSNGKDIDNIEISVKLFLLVDDREIEAKKIQKQSWVKKRGTDVTEFKGNTNEYEIDTIPKQEKDMKEFVTSLVGEELFKILSNPTYFVSLEWKKQREVLLKLVSEITDEDVIDSNHKKFDGLRLALNVHSVDDLMAKAKKTYSELKKKQDELPTRIDEASKSLVHIDVAEQELQKADLVRQIEAIEKQEEDSTAQFDEFNKFSDRIMAIKMQMSDMEREANSKIIEQKSAIQKRIDAADQSFKEAVFKQCEAEKGIDRVNESIRFSSIQKQDLLKQYYTAKATVFNEDAWVFDEDELNCKMCGQPLPLDQQENRKADFEVRKKTEQARFEKEKTELVLKIQDQGKEITSKINDLTVAIADYQKIIETTKADKVKFNGEKNKAMEELAQIPQSADMSGNKEHEALQVELSDMEQSLASMSIGADYRHQLKIKKNGLKEELAAVEKIIASTSVNEKIEERIAELQSEQKEIGQLVANQEKDIFILEEFTRAKMDMLSSRINAKFKMVNFKLFDMQINGGMKETCECTVNGVAFSELNNGHRIVAGLDIIRTLSDLYETHAPIFLDNAESINDYNLPTIESQMILLSVSDDKELRVEGN